MLYATELTVLINNVTSSEGEIYISAWDSEAKWIEHTNAVSWTRSSAAAPYTTITLELPEGHYPFSIYHDIDGNQPMTYDNQGLPTEPWGLSNDATVKDGPPKWQDLVVTVEVDRLTIEITLRYA